MDGPIFEDDVEERRHVTAGDEAAITLLAVVEGGKHVAIDPTPQRITVDPACADAFQVTCDAIAPIVDTIKVLERDGFGSQSLVVPMWWQVRAHHEPDEGVGSCDRSQLRVVARRGPPPARRGAGAGPG